LFPEDDPEPEPVDVAPIIVPLKQNDPDELQKI